MGGVPTGLVMIALGALLLRLRRPLGAAWARGRAAEAGRSVLMNPDRIDEVRAQLTDPVSLAFSAWVVAALGAALVVLGLLFAVGRLL